MSKPETSSSNSVTLEERELYTRLAKKFETPLYVYSENSILDQLSKLQETFSDLKHTICYAVKANSNLAILSLLKDKGCGFDIVSGGELYRLIKLNVNPEFIVFSGVGKTIEEIELALRNNVSILNVESIAELELINEIASQCKIKAPVSLRVNPNISVDIHPYVATGLKSAKFGISSSMMEEALAVIRTCDHIDLIGIDCHIGSGIVDVDPLITAYKEILSIAKNLRAEGFNIKHLDLGGGFGVPFSGHYGALNLSKFKEEVNKIFKNEDFHLILEPGKFLITEAGVLLTKVLYLKNNDDKKFIVVDAGMNDLLRPSLYSSYHKIDVITDNNDKSDTFDVVGPVCETGCFLAQSRELIVPKKNDLLVVRDAGAYGFTMASNYNSRRLPAEVLVNKDRTSYKLIRERESYEELWRNERV